MAKKIQKDVPDVSNPPGADGDNILYAILYRALLDVELKAGPEFANAVRHCLEYPERFGSPESVTFTSTEFCRWLLDRVVAPVHCAWTVH